MPQEDDSVLEGSFIVKPDGTRRPALTTVPPPSGVNHQEFNEGEAGEVSIIKAGTNKAVKMKDLPPVAHDPQQDAADALHDKHMLEDVTRKDGKE